MEAEPCRLFVRRPSTIAEDQRLISRWKETVYRTETITRCPQPNFVKFAVDSGHIRGSIVSHRLLGVDIADIHLTGVAHRRSVCLAWVWRASSNGPETMTLPPALWYEPPSRQVPCIVGGSSQADCGLYWTGSYVQQHRLTTTTVPSWSRTTRKAAVSM